MLGLSQDAWFGAPWYQLPILPSQNLPAATHSICVLGGGRTVGVGVGTDDNILSFLWLWQGGCPDQLVCGSDPDLDRGVSCSMLAIRLKSAHTGVPGELRLFICLSFCL